jgi:hypothetical protein
VSSGTAGHDRATRVALDSSGRVYVLGRCEAPSDTFVRKYTAGGSLAWSRILVTQDGEFVDAMTVDAYGEVYTGGRTGGDEGEGFFASTSPMVLRRGPARSDAQPRRFRCRW